MGVKAQWRHRGSGIEGKLGKGGKENKESRKEKERSMSFGNIEEMRKRKREGLMELDIRVGRGKGNIFDKSKKTPRSP